jgi:uncharacterized protein (TIGR03083 family)
MTMLPDDYLTALEQEGDALLAAGSSALDAPVRACPEWNGADLVYHIGEVHRFWRRVVAERWTEYHEGPDPERPGESALVDWARNERDELLRVLRGADPATKVWTWSTGDDVAWVQRRMAQETAVHRWDAEVAAGIDASIQPNLASDGVDEYLAYFLGARPVAPGSVHLHATDAPGEWLVRFGDGDPKVTREHAKGDAAMRGPAAELLLALWQRFPLADLDLIGDTGAVDRLMSIGIRG